MMCVGQIGGFVISHGTSIGNGQGSISTPTDIQLCAAPTSEGSLNIVKFTRMRIILDQVLLDGTGLPKREGGN